MTDTSAPPVLSAVEARALGCLIEKEATTPDAYPLTVNATVVAANQKTSREPVLSLSPGDVQHALRQLEGRGLARQQFSSRAVRYEHRLAAALDLTQQQVILIGLLLLRGAQTANELLARAERMARFADAEDVRHQLERLAQRQLVLQLPRASGQREDRYMHLLGGPVDAEALAAAFRLRPAASGSDELEARVQALEAELAELRAIVAGLQANNGAE
ncbi:DUF480 domain-containing protein [Xanthomonas hyacinthi]|uniref:DUF480 domain-containing protein n=1 Tax=Xanthomonas hyacinthi TaxID=56455 RepID=A0A2S7ER98_9XANT|nr:DUF480 domain-containing protein [Xanthomonas hyacinthi]KLD79513.1 hypothetical protein Y886_04155 [Xanthomonas hyacinthi DSM 19077]PPU95629.1 DUF480 domain-containing protein [Xanthomonas hyacinthi]QGY77018.1 DUF480 domain-containing protein [Xanthomonas hyacinthi]